MDDRDRIWFAQAFSRVIVCICVVSAIIFVSLAAEMYLCAVVILDNLK